MELRSGQYTIAWDRGAPVCTSGLNSFDFIGMNMDIERAVDMGEDRQRIADAIEEDDLETCLEALQSVKHTCLYIRSVIQLTQTSVFSICTHWVYPNPDTSLVSRRYIFYVLFNRSPSVSTPGDMFKSMLRRLSLLGSRSRRGRLNCK